MLAAFITEEGDTGCAHWAATTPEDGDRVFTLEPHGFPPADRTRHQQLTKSAGPTGWWGWIQEDDDPDTTPGGREHARLAAFPLTYPEAAPASRPLWNGS